MFTNKQQQDTKNMEFKNNIVNWPKTVKYLRVTIDSKLNFTKHIKAILQKAYEAKFLLYSIIN